MASDTTTATSLASDLAPALQFLLDHPDLPAPRGVDVGWVGGSLSIIAFIDAAHQVQVWADALGLEVRSSEHKGNAHHSVCTFEPFYVNVTAIIPAEVTS